MWSLGGVRRFRPPTSSLWRRASSTDLRKRFYKKVSVTSDGDNYGILLDDRPLRTPLKNLLALPSRQAATALAYEWDSQDGIFAPYNMPLTQLANVTIDEPTERTPAQQVEDILKYLKADTLRHLDDSQEKLVKLQDKQWTPIRHWFENWFNISLPCSKTILMASTSEESLAAVKSHLLELNKWQRLSMESATGTCKSLIVAMAMMEGQLTVDEALDVSILETKFQVDRWGEVEWAHEMEWSAQRMSLSAARLLYSWCGPNEEKQ